MSECVRRLGVCNPNSELVETVCRDFPVPKPFQVLSPMNTAEINRLQQRLAALRSMLAIAIATVRSLTSATPPRKFCGPRHWFICGHCTIRRLID